MSCRDDDPLLYVAGLGGTRPSFAKKYFLLSSFAHTAPGGLRVLHVQRERLNFDSDRPACANSFCVACCDKSNSFSRAFQSSGGPGKQ